MSFLFPHPGQHMLLSVWDESHPCGCAVSRCALDSWLMPCRVSLHVFIGHRFMFSGEVSLQTVLNFI